VRCEKEKTEDIDHPAIEDTSEKRCLSSRGWKTQDFFQKIQIAMQGNAMTSSEATS
jgi:hypothetical protein